jgi:hypothetical protein
VAEYRDDMLKATSDPDAWGPAKAFAAAAQDKGVDLSDPDAVNAFVEQYNQQIFASQTVPSDPAQIPPPAS